MGEGKFATRTSEGSDELLEFSPAELEEEPEAALELKLLICGIRVESKIAV